MAKKVAHDKEKTLGKKVIVTRDIDPKTAKKKKKTFRDRLRSGLVSMFGNSKKQKSIEHARGQAKKRVDAEVKRHMKAGGKGGEDFQRMTLAMGMERAAKEMKKDKR